MNASETGRGVWNRKHESVKTFNTKPALIQHVTNFDHGIDWDNITILKSESRAFRRRGKFSDKTKGSFTTYTVINRNDGANFPAFCSVFTAN